MPRAVKGAARRRAKRRIFKAAKGYRGGRSKLLRTAKESLARSWAYAYRDRRARKRDFRRLWITRLSAACRQRDVSYSRFIAGLAQAGIALDRKTLAHIAVTDPATFDKILEAATATKTAA